MNNVYIKFRLTHWFSLLVQLYSNLGKKIAPHDVRSSVIHHYEQSCLNRPSSGFHRSDPLAKGWDFVSIVADHSVDFVVISQFGFNCRSYCGCQEVGCFFVHEKRWEPVSAIKTIFIIRLRADQNKMSL